MSTSMPQLPSVQSLHQSDFMAAKNNIHVDMSPMNNQTNLLSKARIEASDLRRKASMDVANVEYRPALGQESFANLGPGSYAHNK